MALKKNSFIPLFSFTKNVYICVIHWEKKKLIFFCLPNIYRERRFLSSCVFFFLGCLHHWLWVLNSTGVKGRKQTDGILEIENWIIGPFVCTYSEARLFYQLKVGSYFYENLVVKRFCVEDNLFKVWRFVLWFGYLILYNGWSRLCVVIGLGL